jgi:hypothetical protein
MLSGMLSNMVSALWTACYIEDQHNDTQYIIL